MIWWVCSRRGRGTLHAVPELDALVGLGGAGMQRPRCCLRPAAAHHLDPPSAHPSCAAKPPVLRRCPPLWAPAWRPRALAQCQTWTRCVGEARAAAAGNSPTAKCPAGEAAAQAGPAAPHSVRALCACRAGQQQQHRTARPPLLAQLPDRDGGRGAGAGRRLWRAHLHPHLLRCLHGDAGQGARPAGCSAGTRKLQPQLMVQPTACALRRAHSQHRQLCVTSHTTCEREWLLAKCWNKRAHVEAQGAHAGGAGGSRRTSHGPREQRGGGKG